MVTGNKKRKTVSQIYNTYAEIYCELYDLNDKTKKEYIFLYIGTKNFEIKKKYIYCMKLMYSIEGDEQYDVVINSKMADNYINITLYNVHKKFLYYLYNLIIDTKEGNKEDDMIANNFKHHDIIKKYINEKILIMLIYKRNKMDPNKFMPFDIIRKLKKFL